MKKLELTQTVSAYIEEVCPSVFNDPVLYVVKAEEFLQRMAWIKFFDPEERFGVQFNYEGTGLGVGIVMPLHDPEKLDPFYLIGMDYLKDYFDSTIGYTFSSHEERISYLNNNYERIKEVLYLADKKAIEKSVIEINRIRKERLKTEKYSFLRYYKPPPEET